MFHSRKIMRFMLSWLGVGLLSLLLGSCDSENVYNTSHRCYLIIDNSVRLDATLGSCMNPMAPGIFCRVYTGTKGGAEHFFVESNVKTSSQILLLAEDKQRTRALGISNDSGLIVGYSNMPGMADSPEFYAFDAICPNCYESNAQGKYKPMTFTDVSYGQCKCTNCNRQYNLNSGGIIVAGEGGRQLYRYRAETSGVHGVLRVSN